MRWLTTIGFVAFFAVSPLVLLGCCEPKDTAATPPPPAIDTRPEPVVAAAAPVQPLPQPAYSERMGVQVSMLPLSAPPPAPPPPPRSNYYDSGPVVLASAPAPMPMPMTTSGVCRVVPEGTPVIYSDPPTVTLSATGEVIDRTGTVFYPTASTPPAYAPAPQTTMYASTATYSQPATTFGPVYSDPVSTISPVAYETTTTYSSPATTPTPGTYETSTTTTTYGAPYSTTPVPVATTTTAAYYPDSAPFTTTTTSAPGVFSPAPVGEMRLVPAPDIPPGDHPNDDGPSQWFEIVRPGNGPIRIGRVSSTCVCVGVRVPNRFIGAGERALIEARTLKRPPANNMTYGIFVNTIEPVAQTLDADVTIRY